jgi:hypothetical protein
MSDTGFNTEAAARFLGVSAASVRRWSDSGELPVRRLGRRGTRRFAESDLARFRDRQPAPRALSSNDAVTIGALRLSQHSHLATFYDSDAGRLRLTLPFLRDGLRAGDACFLVVGARLRELYVAALEHEGIRVEEAIDGGGLTILPGIGPRTEDALAAWEDGFWKAVNRGARQLRVVGEMESEREAFESEAEMIAYEFAVNALIERFPCVALCQYDVRAFAGSTILGALKAHPGLLGSRLASALL